MDYYVQFDKQGPVDAETDDYAALKASEELIREIKALSTDEYATEALMRIGFKVIVSKRG